MTPDQDFALRYRAAVEMWRRFYWPCEISWKWVREGYKPGSYGASA